MAHPKNNTQYVDKDFQYICLLAKTRRIMENLISESFPKFYDFEDYKFVLNTGLETEEFTDIDNLDFATVISKIDYFYSEFLENNTYEHLINSNRI